MVRSVRLLAGLLLALCLFTSSLHASDPKPKTVSKKDIPQAVVTAFQKSYPEGKIRSCKSDQKDGAAVYVLRTQDGRDRRTLTYNGGGLLLESWEQVEVSKVPLKVTGAYVARYPRAKFLRAEKLVKGTTITYKVTVVQEKTRFEDLYDTSGNLLPAKQ